VKIAIVIERFARGPGGAEFDALQLTREFLKSGHDVTVVCRRTELPAEPGLSVVRLRVPNLWQPLRLIRFSEKARKATAEGFDIVHSFARTRHQHIYRSGGGSHAEYMEQVYPRARLQRLLNPRHRAILSIEKAVFQDPTQIIHCIARTGADEIARRYGVPRSRLVTIYNGVDSDRFHPRLREVHRNRLRDMLNLSGPVALFVGGGFHRKGLDRAIRGLAETDTGADLLVVGGGAKDAARDLARQLGVERRVYFLGQRSDVEIWHAAADLLVLPTRYDPFANVVLEGMASGLPVATTPAAGAAELITHGENGFIFQDDFKAAFDLLKNPEQLDEVGAAARRTAEGFTWSHHANQLLELYEKIRT
jgi:UDP-glucose:(heptosyl)LPS alpha-1,3-glucosyltransferase